MSRHVPRSFHTKTRTKAKRFPRLGESGFSDRVDVWTKVALSPPWERVPRYAHHVTALQFDTKGQP